MTVKIIFAVEVLVFVGVVLIGHTSAWSGNIVPYYRWEQQTCQRCLCRYSWGCSAWRYFACTVWTQSFRCKDGYRHNGNENCSIPICYPNCGNRGVCIRPNECDCRGTSTGQFCQTLTCSYEQPCYPGNCYSNNKCNCTKGFELESAAGYPDKGCLKMSADNKPYIGRSTTILSHIRRTDNKQFYNFLLDGTDEKQAYVVWVNQRYFNTLSFEFETKFQQPEDIPERPFYVHATELGMVYANVTVKVIDYKDVERANYLFECTGASDGSPVSSVFNCSIQNQAFKTLMEHADTLRVTYLARSGGYRRMRNTYTNVFLPHEYFQGVEDRKQIEFKFDLIAPRFCSENGSTATCSPVSTVLQAVREFTKEPIEVRWQGWGDDPYGSGIWMYYLEVHKLMVKDQTLELTEKNAVGPLFKKDVMSNGNSIHTATFTPTEPGMYSILMETRDISNNSRIARRFVLYDPVSVISVNSGNRHGLHVSSAVEEANFLWQTTTTGNGTPITVDWTDYFVNTIHDTGMLLNAIKPFPVQFKDLEDDNILFAKKFVDPSLDDNEGKRTNESIDNLHGIVKFQYATVYTKDESEPADNEWIDIALANKVSFIDQQLTNGYGVRIWVKAFDTMGNTKTESTTVTLDSTYPQTSNTTDNETRLIINDGSNVYNYSSSIEFIARDPESGVKNLGVRIAIHTPNKPDKTFTTMVPANTDDTRDPETSLTCYPVKDKSTCFIIQQTVHLDNCWFMVPKKTDLAISSATVDVVVYNQAMLTRTLTFEVDKISRLAGLATYSGPQNIRITNQRHDSFRVAWDLPEKESCYGRADIQLLIMFKNATGGLETRMHTVGSTATYFDVGNLNSNTEYKLMFSSLLGGGGTTDEVQLAAMTGSPPVADVGASTGLVVGVAVGVLVILALAIVIVVILVRRGVIHPAQRARTMKRAVTKKYRQTFHDGGENGHRARSNPEYVYDNRQSELYLYGGIGVEGPQPWHIDRHDIVFQTLITSGRFANIYKASLTRNKTTETVVAKTLKENFSADDELLMKAKMNFTGTVTGEHPNVLKFIGAVVTDDTMGPFIIYEYCEHGTLKEYLVSQKNNLTMELQENLFRIGLDVAKGMEYLAAKGIVHRRLAARNILLTFLNEARISGFGPQPAEDGKNESDQTKRERIPIKWMAPECMTSTTDATEQSDVWSYAVVLWEIFTLGETPYDKIRSGDLPAKLKKGERLNRPEQCDDTWYAVMNRCWTYEAEKRPRFAEIRNELDSLFVAAPGDDYYYYKR